MSDLSPSHVINPLDLEPEVRAVWYDGYSAGCSSVYADAYAHGRRDRMAEEEAAWRSMAEFIRKQGGPFGVPYSVLCDRRRDRKRARSARRNEARIRAGQPLERGAA